MIGLYLINQPQSTWEKEDRYEGHTDTSITSLGKRQSQQLVTYFQSFQFDGLITSPMTRSIQTAKILRKHYPHKIIRDSRIADVNIGLWSGKFQEEVEGRYPESWHQWQNNPLTTIWPEGESFLAVEQRVDDFLKSFKITELFDKYYVVITHDIIIKIILSRILNLSFKEINNKYSLHKGSITNIEVAPNLRTEKINEIEHLCLKY